MTWAAVWNPARWSWGTLWPAAATPTGRDPAAGVPPGGPYRTNAAGLVPRPAPAAPRPSARPGLAPQIPLRYPGRLQRLQKQLMGDVVGGRCTQAEALVRWEHAVSDWMFGK